MPVEPYVRAWKQFTADEWDSFTADYWDNFIAARASTLGPVLLLENLFVPFTEAIHGPHIKAGTPYSGITKALNPNITGFYRRDFEDIAEFSISDVAIDDDWTEGGLIEVRKGYYSLGVPDDAYIAPTVDVPSRGTLIGLSDTTDAYLYCLGTYDPLQRVVEAVSFTTDGDLYAAAADIYDVFGQANVYKWANIDSLATDDPLYLSTILARITTALTYATADINDKLRGGPYTIPFTDATLVANITRACVLKTGVWLYEWRGADDFDYENGKVVHRYSFLEPKADTILENVRRDAIRLDATSNIRAPGVGD